MHMHACMHMYACNIIQAEMIMHANACSCTWKFAIIVKISNRIKALLYIVSFSIHLCDLELYSHVK